MKKFVLCLVVFSFVFCAPLAAEKWVGDTIITDIKTPAALPKVPANTLVWSYTIEQPGMSWIKIHFDKFRLNDADYIELLDQNGVVIEHILGSELSNIEETIYKVSSLGNGKISFWGPAVDGETVTVNLYAGSDKSVAYGFEIDQLGIGTFPMFEEPMLESICGADDKVSIACVATSPYQNLGKAVGRMLYQSGSSWYVCTGFLCSCNSSHFLTNEHCITSQAMVDTLQVRFNYRLSTCGGSSASYTTYYGNSFVTDSTTYDFCLLTLGGSPQNTYGYLGLINGNPIVGESIYIIQHPGGRQQEIGFGTVYTTTANGGKDLSYYVDTEGGSSGSPVFAEIEDEVIGLHHYGGCPNSAVKMNYIYEYITNYLGCN